jgi:hypothetical protein
MASKDRNTKESSGFHRTRCIADTAMVLLLLLISVIVTVSGECPASDVLSDQQAEPAIEQVGSKVARVDWSDLWPDIDWTECFSEAKIVSEKADEISIDLNAKEAEVTVEPCTETRFKVVATTVADGVKVESHRTRRGFKTSKPPMGKQPPEDSKLHSYRVDVNNGIMDLTKIDLTVAFADVADDPSCNRVNATELRFRKVGSESDVWTVADRPGMHPTLKMTVEGLDDVCASYEVVLVLMGTDGTESSEVKLVTVGPVSPETRMLAYESGFMYNVTGPDILSISDIGANGAIARWPESDCADYYAMTVTSKGYENTQMLHPSKSRFDFEDLTPCTEYRISLGSRLNTTDPSKTFESNEVTDTFVTEAAFSSSEDNTFNLTSLHTRSGRTSVTLSWLPGEYPCLKDKYDVEMCLRQEEEEDGERECSHQFNMNQVGEKTVAVIQNLRACSSYNVSKNNNADERSGWPNDCNIILGPYFYLSYLY